MENPTLPEFVAENVPLREHSTFKIGGPARYFSVVRSEAEARRALDFALANRLRVFVLGRGSNLLISDRGFDGLVIKMENRRVKLVESGNQVTAELDGGVVLAKLISDLQPEGIGGLEWAAGIPASVGGMVSNNAGAKAHAMSEAVRSVRVLEMKFAAAGNHLESYAERELDSEQCEFSYRDSVFKRTKNCLILGATLALQKGEPEAIRQAIAQNLRSRAEKQPLAKPNIGSIFRNPVLGAEGMDRFEKQCPGAREMFPTGAVPAGWLIEEANLKGEKVGGALISEKHANFIVNAQAARAEDVVILISRIKERVRAKFDIQLHEEIEYVGF